MPKRQRASAKTCQRTGKNPVIKSTRNPITLDLSAVDRKEVESYAVKLGYSSVEEYLYDLHNARVQQHEALRDTSSTRYPKPEHFFSTGHGNVYHGDSLGLMDHFIKPKSVDLVMTSPPFGLVRKKDYGNEDADRYLNWFRPFAERFKRVLKPQGSLVIDIGGAWKSGTPTRSLYHFELLIMLCRDYGFHLCQEHYWWSPSKLPTPAEWVNIRRIRVKDAVNCVWWLSPTPWPKANNRRILSPYSDSMHSLLKNGYKAKLRPSGHDISTKFSRDNGGSVPPNLLAIANTESNGKYQDFCRTNGYPVHPARFPSSLPEYFIRMLTDKSDLVLDPFGGSCVTGEAAERLERRWLCCEMNKDYLLGAKGRFQERTSPARVKQSEPYSIFPPCSLPLADKDFPLVADGGKSRPKHIKRDGFWTTPPGKQPSSS